MRRELMVAVTVGKGTASRCSGAYAGIWPPLTAATGVAGRGVLAGRPTSARSSAGYGLATEATYAGGIVRHLRLGHSKPGARHAWAGDSTGSAAGRHAADPPPLKKEDRERSTLAAGVKRGAWPRSIRGTAEVLWYSLPGRLDHVAECGGSRLAHPRRLTPDRARSRRLRPASRRPPAPDASPRGDRARPHREQLGRVRRVAAPVRRRWRRYGTALVEAVHRQPAHRRRQEPAWLLSGQPARSAGTWRALDRRRSSCRRRHRLHAPAS